MQISEKDYMRPLSDRHKSLRQKNENKQFCFVVRKEIEIVICTGIILQVSTEVVLGAARSFANKMMSPYLFAVWVATCFLLLTFFPHSTNSAKKTTIWPSFAVTTEMDTTKCK